MAAPEKFTFDVCISHARPDGAVARRIAEDMGKWRYRKKGTPLSPLSVVTSESAADAGQFRSILNRSRSLVLIISRHGTGSPLIPPDEQSRRYLNPSDFDRRFVPMVLEANLEGEVPGDLKPRRWFSDLEDLFGDLYSIVTPPERPMPAPVRRRLRAVLRGHASHVSSLSLSADGRVAAARASDGIVRVWDIEERTTLVRLDGHYGVSRGVAISADGRRITSSMGVSGSKSKLLVWEPENGGCVVGSDEQKNVITGVSISPDGVWAASVTEKGELNFWSADVRFSLSSLDESSAWHTGVALSDRGDRAATCSSDGLVQVWDVTGRSLLASLKGHSQFAGTVSISADGRLVASGSKDRTARIWDVEARTCLCKLEGHTEIVNAVSLTPDGRLAASGSGDGTVRVWDVAGRRCLATLEGHTGRVTGVALSADGNRAVSSTSDGLLWVWDLCDLNPTEAPSSATYSSAKILLTGDSGVGKSGLAHWMIHENLVPTLSTDAVWATILKIPDAAPLPEGAEREIWLWDFAGQPDYRLNHLLYMDGTDVALQVFNPQHDDPYEGLAEWDRAITLAAGDRPFCKILVAGRVDRGGLRVSGEKMKSFAADRGFLGYHETSALSGHGCADLRRAILDAIPWDKLPCTSSPAIFRRIKAEVVRLKDEGRRVLLRIGDLEAELKARMADDPFRPEEFLTVVRLLAGSGAIWLLPYEDHRSRSNSPVESDRWASSPSPTIDWVLLQPERINSYAAAVVRQVKKHPEEIGCIGEDAVMATAFEVPKETKLPGGDEQVVIREMIGTMIARGICLREHTSKGTLLVFPAYYRRERPEFPTHPPVFVSYEFRGVLDEVYTTLVVRLHHTEAFDKDKLYKDAADFKAPGGRLRAGLKLVRKPESVGEIIVYLDHDMPRETKVTFMRFVDDHLRAPHRAADIVRTRSYVCPVCGTPVESHDNVRKKIKEGKRFILCVECENRVELFDQIEALFGTPEIREKAREWNRQAQVEIDDQSKELVMTSEVGLVVGNANQIFRPVLMRDEGIDAEVEFTVVEGGKGRGSGKRLWLQLKAGDSYLRRRKTDGVEVFDIKKPRWAEYWQQQADPVMLVVRTSNGLIRWMDVGAALKEKARQGETEVRSLEFLGEPFTVENLLKKRDESFV
jgi:WD40 repeat protein